MQSKLLELKQIIYIFFPGNEYCLSLIEL